MLVTWSFRSLVLALSLVLCAGDALAQMRQATRQIGSRSNHADNARIMAEQQQWDRLESAFDPAEAAAMLEPGDGSLRGVLGFSQRTGILKRTTVTADREWVELFPVTGYMQQMIDTFRLAEPGQGRPHVHTVPAKYSGRVLTDRQGRFEFHGLKPGRYFLVGRVPYTVRTVTQVDTGEREISYSYTPAFGSGTGTISPVYRKEYGVASDERWVTAIVEVGQGTATIFEPPAY